MDILNVVYKKNYMCAYLCVYMSMCICGSHQILKGFMTPKNKNCGLKCLFQMVLLSSDFYPSSPHILL